MHRLGQFVVLQFAPLHAGPVPLLKHPTVSPHVTGPLLLHHSQSPPPGQLPGSPRQSPPQFLVLSGSEHAVPVMVLGHHLHVPPPTQGSVGVP